MKILTHNFHGERWLYEDLQNACLLEFLQQLMAKNRKKNEKEEHKDLT